MSPVWRIPGWNLPIYLALPHLVTLRSSSELSLNYLWLSFVGNAPFYALVLKADLKENKWTHPSQKRDVPIAIPEVAIFACENTQYLRKSLSKGQTKSFGMKWCGDKRSQRASFFFFFCRCMAVVQSSVGWLPGWSLLEYNCALQINLSPEQMPMIFFILQTSGLLPKHHRMRKGWSVWATDCKTLCLWSVFH